jgi:hypothetical protein
MSDHDPERTSTPCTAAGLGNPVRTSRLKPRIESELLADLTSIECGGSWSLRSSAKRRDAAALPARRWEIRVKELIMKAILSHGVD